MTWNNQFENIFGRSPKDNNINFKNKEKDNSNLLRSYIHSV